MRGVGLTELMVVWGPPGPVRDVRGGKKSCAEWAPRAFPPGQQAARGPGTQDLEPRVRQSSFGGINTLFF